jgi:hypothetical protein
MDNNITMEKTEKEVTPQQPQQPDLNNLVIADENTALNVMVSFLHMAQKRGAFNIQESAKVWECVQMFMKRQ